MRQGVGVGVDVDVVSVSTGIVFAATKGGGSSLFCSIGLGEAAWSIGKSGCGVSIVGDVVTRSSEQPAPRRAPAIKIVIAIVFMGEAVTGFYYRGLRGLHG